MCEVWCNTYIPDLSPLQICCSSNQIAEQEGSQINVPMTLFLYRCHLSMYTANQSMHCSEQNFIWCTLHDLVMIFIFHSGLLGAVLELLGEITHTGVQIYSAGRMSFCLCNLCQLHSQDCLNNIMLLVLIKLSVPA